MVLKTPLDQKRIQPHYEKENRDINWTFISLIRGINPVTDKSQYLVLKRIGNI